jgi:hypothetical protein
MSAGRDFNKGYDDGFAGRDADRKLRHNQDYLDGYDEGFEEAQQEDDDNDAYSGVFEDNDDYSDNFGPYDNFNFE